MISDEDLVINQLVKVTAGGFLRGNNYHGKIGRIVYISDLRYTIEVRFKNCDNFDFHTSEIEVVRP